MIVGVAADSFNYGADIYLLSACRLVGLRSLDRDLFAVLNINVFNTVVKSVFDSGICDSDFDIVDIYHTGYECLVCRIACDHG